MVFSGFRPPLRACLFLSHPYTLHALNRSSNLPLSVFLRDTIFLPFDSVFQPFSLVSTRFLQARLVSDIIGGLGETFQWKNVASRVSVWCRIEKTEKFPWVFPRFPHFFPHCILISFERLTRSYFALFSIVMTVYWLRRNYSIKTNSVFIIRQASYKL